jgi:hypothetical protein
VRQEVRQRTGASKRWSFSRPTCSAVRLGAQASDVLICTIFLNNSYPTVKMIYMINVNERAPLAALEFHIAIHFEKVSDKCG